MGPKLPGFAQLCTADQTATVGLASVPVAGEADGGLWARPAWRTVPGARVWTSSKMDISPQPSSPAAPLRPHASVTSAPPLVALSVTSPEPSLLSGLRQTGTAREWSLRCGHSEDLATADRATSWALPRSAHLEVAVTCRPGPRSLRKLETHRWGLHDREWPEGCPAGGAPLGKPKLNLGCGLRGHLCEHGRTGRQGGPADRVLASGGWYF